MYSVWWYQCTCVTLQLAGSAGQYPLHCQEISLTGLAGASPLC